MAPRARRKPSLTDLGNRVLLVLAHHRMATTPQLQRLVRPGSTQPRHLRKILRNLRRDGLVDRVFRPGGGDSVWFATRTGTSLTQTHGGVPARPYRMDVNRAAGPLQQHALTVNEAGLSFLEHGRRSGLSLGSLSWTPEVAHRYHFAGRDHTLISDAVLDYAHEDGQWRYDLSYAIEIDRATMPVRRLAEKVLSYCRYAAYAPAVRNQRRSVSRPTPAWQSKYRWFPVVLVVLTGGTPRAMHSRRYALRRMVVPWASGPNDTVRAGVVYLDDLLEHGPAAQIATPLHYEAEKHTDVVAGLAGD